MLVLGHAIFLFSKNSHIVYKNECAVTALPCCFLRNSLRAHLSKQIIRRL